MFDFEVSSQHVLTRPLVWIGVAPPHSRSVEGASYHTWSRALRLHQYEDAAGSAAQDTAHVAAGNAAQDTAHVAAAS